jgi:hypothetical protein
MKNFLLYVIVSLLALLFCLEGVTLPKGGRTMQGSYSSTHQVPSAARAVGSDFLPPEEPDSAAGSPVKAAWRSPAASPGETAAVPTVSWRRNIGRALFEVSVAGLGKEAEESSLPPLTGIDSSAVRPLDMGMVNVTEGRGAYRLQLPSGGAEADVRVELPYDTALLPAGYGPRDIETYCYDRAHRVWTAIAKDTTDEGTMVVVSELHLGREWLEAAENGGGDGSEGPKSPGLEFINAVMRTPEMPETSAIAPTSLKELKAADPLEGVVMIQPPEAGNDGGASLSYPLEIPSGRQGMQPDLSLTYSSGGENGNRIGTSGVQTQDPAGSLIVKAFIKNGISVRKDIHSHPDVPAIVPTPGIGDMFYAKYAKETYGDKAPPMYVYGKTRTDSHTREGDNWEYIPYSFYGKSFQLAKIYYIRESVDSSRLFKKISPLVISDSSFYHILDKYFAIKIYGRGHVLLIDIKRSVRRGYSIKLMIIDTAYLDIAVQREFKSKKRFVGYSEIGHVTCFVFGCFNPIFRKDPQGFCEYSSIIERVVSSLTTAKQRQKSIWNLYNNLYNNEENDYPPVRTNHNIFYFFYKDGEYIPRFYKGFI